MSAPRSLLIEVNTSLREHKEMLSWLAQAGYTYDEKQLENSLRKEGPFKGCGECVLVKQVIASPRFHVLTFKGKMLRKLRGAEMREIPFPHLYVEDVMPESVLQDLPGDGFVSLEEARGTKGYPQRMVRSTKDISFLSWLTADNDLKALLDERFGVSSGVAETLLMRDLPGYEIGPHTDTPSKCLTALFYTTKNWTEAEHGTTLYEPLIDGFECSTGKHYNAKGFKGVWTAPGKPGSVLIFARTNTSFHGARKYAGTGAREILLWNTFRL